MKIARIWKLLFMLLTVAVLSGCFSLREDVMSYEALTDTIIDDFRDNGISINVCKENILASLRRGRVVLTDEVKFREMAGYEDIVFEPLYQSMLVIAAEGEYADKIKGWNDLLASDCPVGISSTWEEFHACCAVPDLQKVFSYLDELVSQKRIRHDLKRPVLIITDDQVVELKKQGRDLTVIYPVEGTPTVLFGLASKEPVSLHPVFQNLRSCDEPLVEGALRDPYARLSPEEYRRLDHMYAHVIPYKNSPNLKSTMLVVILMLYLVWWLRHILDHLVYTPIRAGFLGFWFSLEAWLTVRVIKWEVRLGIAASRYLWYSYYLCELLLVFFFTWLSMYFLRDEKDGNVKKRLKILGGMDAGIILMVMTNDLHQLMFRFLGYEMAENRFVYGPLFYVVMGLLFIQMFFAVARLVRKTMRTADSWRLLPIAAVMIAYMVFAVMYAVSLPPFQRTDFTLVTVISVIGLMQLFLINRLLPVNTRYEDFFHASTLAMQIMDKKGREVFASELAEPLSEEIRDRLMAGEQRLQNNERMLYADRIPGGVMVYEEDIGSLQKVYDETAETVRKLRFANDILEKERAVSYEKEYLNYRSSLFDMLEKEISGMLERVSVLVGELKEEDSFEKRTMIALLVCRIKRHASLFFLSKSSRTMKSDELIVYFDELGEIISLAGVKVYAICLNVPQITIVHAILFYSVFFEVLSWTLKASAKVVYARLHQEDGRIRLKMMLDQPLTPMQESHSLIQEIRRNEGAIEYHNTEDVGGLWVTFGGADHV